MIEAREKEGNGQNEQKKKKIFTIRTRFHIRICQVLHLQLSHEIIKMSIRKIP